MNHSLLNRFIMPSPIMKLSYLPCSRVRKPQYLLVSFLLLVLTWQGTIAFQSITPVPRISIKDYTPIAYQDEPLIVETNLSVESLCEELMTHISSKTITLQHKAQPQTKYYECTIDQAIDPIMLKSRHGNSFFAFCEGLLEDCSNGKDITGKEIFDHNVDWFDYFPKHVQPSDCVILAGEGATSTLHRDPFEWTGTSLCLEGTKLWRFLKPSPQDKSIDQIDELVQAYRLPSVAWTQDDNDDEITLSAGWQSDFSLYANRCKSVPSAKSLSELTDKDRFEQLDSIALDPTPSLQSNNEELTQCECWTVVQKPGDLLLIPAHWWHQTYALEPSLAIASQRCDSRFDAKRVIQHILQTTGTLDEAPKTLLEEDYASYKDKESISEIANALFDHLERSLSIGRS